MLPRQQWTSLDLEGLTVRRWYTLSCSCHVELSLGGRKYAGSRSCVRWMLRFSSISLTIETFIGRLVPARQKHCLPKQGLSWRNYHSVVVTRWCSYFSLLGKVLYSDAMYLLWIVACFWDMSLKGSGTLVECAVQQDGYFQVICYVSSIAFRCPVHVNGTKW
jgi:hypothetical protein